MLRRRWPGRACDGFCKPRPRDAGATSRFCQIGSGHGFFPSGLSVPPGAPPRSASAALTASRSRLRLARVSRGRNVRSDAKRRPRNTDNPVTNAVTAKATRPAARGASPSAFSATASRTGSMASSVIASSAERTSRAIPSPNRRRPRRISARSSPISCTRRSSTSQKTDGSRGLAAPVPSEAGSRGGSTVSRGKDMGLLIDHACGNGAARED
jgi:hypothetical protein